MRDGRLQQVDTPQRLYDAPVNLFVASFVGSPAMNLFEAGLESDDGKLVCRIGDTDLELPSDLTAERPSLANYAGRRVAVGIRPEDVREAAGWDGTRYVAGSCSSSPSARSSWSTSRSPQHRSSVRTSSTPPPSSQVPPWVSTTRACR
jgi:ABC-type sugar transport systems, ATPase components